MSRDCLYEIFELLEDKADLRSCLLVNRLWCEVSVPILWTSIQNYNTLIACLSKESKEILYKNEIVISTPTSKPPLFNYVTFIKSLSIYEIVRKNPNINNRKNIVVSQEIFKMLMNQISLKKLNLYHHIRNLPYIPFITYPGAINCL